jgi:hypothetical protein
MVLRWNGWGWRRRCLWINSITSTFYPVNPILKINKLFFCFFPLLFSSCFLIKTPIAITSTPIKDTVTVYHFIVSNNHSQIADSATFHSFVWESKRAFDWISDEASRKNQNLVFKEIWVANKNPHLKHTFIHKLPSNNLQTLRKKNFFRIVIKKKTKTQKEETQLIDWNKDLFDSIPKQLNDSSIASILYQTNNLTNAPPPNQLIMVHLLKVEKSKVLGFYKRSVIHIGLNKSDVIAHESIHYLGAPDIYIHKYWLGKRRRIVRKKLKHEIMNDGSLKLDCTDSYVSNYTAFTIGWNKYIEPEYMPLLKQNLMAKVLFDISMLFPFF